MLHLYWRVQHDLVKYPHSNNKWEPYAHPCIVSLRNCTHQWNHGLLKQDLCHSLYRCKPTISQKGLLGYRFLNWWKNCNVVISGSCLSIWAGWCEHFWIESQYTVQCLSWCDAMMTVPWHFAFLLFLLGSTIPLTVDPIFITAGIVESDVFVRMGLFLLSVGAGWSFHVDQWLMMVFHWGKWAFWQCLLTNKKTRNETKSSTSSCFHCLLLLQG